MKDLTKQPKKIKDKFNEVKTLVKDIKDVDDKTVSVFAQTPLREKLGLPPMELRNTLEGALSDLKTISDLHQRKELDGIS